MMSSIDTIVADHEVTQITKDARRRARDAASDGEARRFVCLRDRGGFVVRDNSRLHNDLTWHSMG
jgi:hypothetical protein